MHFELTDETREFEGRTLYRIRATEDIPYFDVKAGDLGGWVEHVDNLGTESWVFSDGIIMDNAFAVYRSSIRDQAIVRDDAHIRASAICDRTIVRDRAYVCDSTLTGNVRIGGDSHLIKVKARRDAVVEGHVNLTSCTVTGNAYIFSSEDILELVDCHFLGDGVYIPSHRAVIGFTQLGYKLDELKSHIPYSPDTLQRVHMFAVHDRQTGRIVPKAAFNGTYKKFDLEKAFTFLKFVDSYSNNGRYAAEVEAIRALVSARVKSWYNS